MEEDLKATNNNLADIIRWINDGYFVTIYAEGRYGRRYCKDIINCKGPIRIDVSSYASLLDDGEWNWYIEQSGTPACDTDQHMTADRTVDFCLG